MGVDRSTRRSAAPRATAQRARRDARRRPARARGPERLGLLVKDVPQALRGRACDACGEAREVVDLRVHVLLERRATRRRACLLRQRGPATRLWCSARRAPVALRHAGAGRIALAADQPLRRVARAGGGV
eukprot:105162-Prymnesium_polylepis.2